MMINEKITDSQQMALSEAERLVLLKVGNEIFVFVGGDKIAELKPGEALMAMQGKVMIRIGEELRKS